MSEEEILKNIKELIQWNDYNTYKIALQGLLDLYNKEKEKNINQFTEIESLKYAMPNMKHIDIINQNYISKDKIKREIEELQSMIVDVYWKEFQTVVNFAIKELQELLEEDNK